MEPSRLHRGKEALLDWYEPRRDAYPWRSTRDPYRVLVSEVMLQQTQASRVVPLYGSFLRRFPSVRALARASRRDVLLAWEGLGYNRRAVSLSDAARDVVRAHGGHLPSDPAALQRLPGIGPYTSAAVASIAFGVPVAAVDTNSRRIVARVFEGRDPIACSRDQIHVLAQAWLDRSDPGAWNQALMDLGREVCRPRPRCETCPLASVCCFRTSGREPAAPRPRQGSFEGSMRQVRGAVVQALRSQASATPGGLARLTGHELDRVEGAVGALLAEGLVEVRRGRVRLPS
jgi:A/G-specific adenine glycosylase